MPAVIAATDEEKTIIADWCTGSRQAFARLYALYAPAMLGIIIHIVPDRSAAENILHDSFVEVWNKKHEFDAAGGRLFIWMSHIARKNALAFAQNAATPQNHNDSSFVYVTDKLMQQQAINKNKDELHDEVLRLMYFKQLTAKQVSDILDIDPAGLRQMLRQAVNRFKTRAQ